MSTPISNITITAFFDIVKNSLPRHIVVNDTKLQQVISNALTRYNAFYVDNDLGVFDDVVVIDFFNASDNDFINSRDLTRWVGISPTNFRASKLISCMLKEANPDLVEYPAGIAYIQDIPISISDSGTVNTSVPSENTGLCSLREDAKLFNVLTLGEDNSWTNLHSITALLSFYRPPILPNWTSEEDQNIDVLSKDFNLVTNYVIENLLRQNTPLNVRQAIQQKEAELLY